MYASFLFHSMYTFTTSFPFLLANFLLFVQTGRNMAFPSHHISFCTPFIHFVFSTHVTPVHGLLPFQISGYFSQFGTSGISMAFHYLYILFSTPSFIFHSSYTFPKVLTFQFTRMLIMSRKWDGSVIPFSIHFLFL
jgi:hypothetical protein